MKLTLASVHAQATVSADILLEILSLPHGQLLEINFLWVFISWTRNKQTNKQMDSSFLTDSLSAIKQTEFNI